MRQSGLNNMEQAVKFDMEAPRDEMVWRVVLEVTTEAVVCFTATRKWVVHDVTILKCATIQLEKHGTTITITQSCSIKYA